MIRTVPTLILCVISIGLVAACGGGSVEDILNKQAEALSAGDAEAFYETCTPAFRHRTSLEDFENEFQETLFYSEPVEFRDIEVSYGEDSAKASADVYLRGYQGPQRAQVLFFKAGGKWYANNC